MISKMTANKYAKAVHVKEHFKPLASFFTQDIDLFSHSALGWQSLLYTELSLLKSHVLKPYPQRWLFFKTGHLNFSQDSMQS